MQQAAAQGLWWQMAAVAVGDGNDATKQEMPFACLKIFSENYYYVILRVLQCSNVRVVIALSVYCISRLILTER